MRGPGLSLVLRYDDGAVCEDDVPELTLGVEAREGAGGEVHKVEGAGSARRL